MKKKIISPALFIGLGGTGSKVLMQVKKAVLKNYGEVPPMTKILCFDTDRRELLSSREELEYNKKNNDGTRSRVTEEVVFQADETIGVPITNPQGLINQDYIKDWVSPLVLKQVGQTDTGAKQIRQLGRFAIFENYMKEDIPGKIRNRINDLKNITQLKSTEYSLGDSQATPCIHLVFSPCGGTGSGTFIDIINIIKNIDPQIKIYGYLVMPDFYSRFPMTTSVAQNAYASLMEIDHLMGQDAGMSTKPDGSPLNKMWSNYNKKPFEVDYSGNNTMYTIPAGDNAFFEYLYLFDNISEKGKFISEVEDVYDRIGRILYLMVSGPGISMQSAYSNNKDFNFPSSPVTNNKRRNYSSMGISQIILERDFLKDLKKNQITKTILNAYCFNDEKLEPKKMSNFIDANSWREDNGKDMVIDKLMPRNQLRYSTDSLYPSDFNRGEWHIEVKANVNSLLSNWDGKIKTNCSNIKEELISDFKVKLNNEVSKYLKEIGGISRCKQFLSFMLGSFEGMSDEMKNEGNTHLSNLEKYRKDDSLYIESIVNEENRFNPFGRENSVRERTDVYIHHSEKILFENWQKIRKEQAKLFFDINIEVIRNHQTEIINSEKLLLETSSQIEREIQRILNTTNNDTDFERSIHYFYKELLIENIIDFNKEEAFRAIDFTEILKFNKNEEIIKLIQNYVIETAPYKALESITVEEILKKLDKDTLKNIIHYLDLSSAVCIDVDESFCLSTDKAKMEKFGFICVENEKESIFQKDGEMFNHVSTEGGYSPDNLRTFTTGNPDAITMVKVAGMFPGSAIKRIENYKNKFETSSQYHYSSTYFEKYAMDLIDGPSDDEGEGLKWFTVASALGKIKLYKGGLILEDPENQKLPLFEGTRNKTNRAEALKVFTKNKDYIKYAEVIFNKQDDEKGKPYITEKFVSFYKAIETVDVLGKQIDNIDKESDEYKNIFNEKKALKNFAMNLTIDPEKFN